MRIGFYTWLDDKNTEYNEGPGATAGEEDAGAKSAFSDVDVQSDKAKGEKPPYKPTPPLLIRILCCGSTNYHWWLDTFVGLLLTAIFCIACGIILGTTPEGPVQNNADLVASNHSGSATSPK